MPIIKKTRTFATYMNVDFIKWDCVQNVHFVTLNIETEQVNIIISYRFV